MVLPATVSPALREALNVIFPAPKSYLPPRILAFVVA
jgi:hypothetical protein